MSNILLLLLSVHQNVHQTTQILSLKKNYSTPRIYTGGVDITLWNQLSKEEQNKALSKDWYIYYKFIDEKTDKLKRMPNIKGGANRLKTKKERIEYLITLRDSLEYLLEKGFNPYKDNDLSLLDDGIIEDKKESQKALVVKPLKPETVQKHIPTVVDSAIEEPIMTIGEAFSFALKIKKSVLNETSYGNFEGRINRFKNWLDQETPITSVDRKKVNEYLNEILEKSSPRNRNNTRIDLSSLFEVLHENEIISENFIKKISVLKSNPERNKTYTPEMQVDIYLHLEKNDPILALFVKFVSYNFLRPVEVCRLKVGDIDIKDRKLYLRAKNKPVKIKIIPEILIKGLPDLSQLDKETFLFTPNKIGDFWDATENNRRDNFSKRFKEVVKDPFNLGIDYGMYSFRHTFITKLYRELRKTFSPFEAKSKLMLITGHSTMKSLEQYLRDIDAELPEDYSHLLE